MANGNRIHGSPYDRGSCDAHYGRGYEAHKFEDNSPFGRKCELKTDEEIKEYDAGYFHTSDRKYGRNIVQREIRKNMVTTTISVFVQFGL